MHAAYGAWWQGGASSGDRRCYHCGEPGHFANNCPLLGRPGGCRARPQSYDSYGGITSSRDNGAPSPYPLLHDIDPRLAAPGVLSCEVVESRAAHAADRSAPERPTLRLSNATRCKVTMAGATRAAMWVPRWNFGCPTVASGWTCTPPRESGGGWPSPRHMQRHSPAGCYQALHRRHSAATTPTLPHPNPYPNPGLPKLPANRRRGTVKTVMDHPTRGRTQMFLQVLQNPRQHTGRGYQRRGTAGYHRGFEPY